MTTDTITRRPDGSPDSGPRGTVLETIAYLALACALCWAVAAPGLLGAVPGELAAGLVPVAQLTPLLATVPFLLLRRSGRAVDVLALRWNRSWRWTGLGIKVVVVVSAVQLGVGLALGWQPRPADAVLPAVVATIPVLVLQSVFAFGEEVGWRGWLVSRLRHLGFPMLALVSAVAWVVWHLPAVALFPLGPAEQAAYLLGIASWAPFFVALRLASGSVWPAVLAHGAVNSVRVFCLQSVAESGGVDWTVEAVGWVLWLAAAVLLARHVGRRRSAGPATATPPALPVNPPTGS